MLNSRPYLTSATATRSAPPSAAPPSPQCAPPSSTGLLTPSAVATMLRVNTKVLERWRGTGDGPRFVRLTRKTIRYQLSDVDAFIGARLRSNTADA